jgi:hypothetical protein
MASSLKQVFRHETRDSLAIRSNPEQLGPEDESTSEYDFWTFFQKGKQVMEWSRLIRFVLLGSRALEPYATLLVRVALGLFFAISGGNKLFVARHTQAMYETLVAAKRHLVDTSDLLHRGERIHRHRIHLPLDDPGLRHRHIK